MWQYSARLKIPKLFVLKLISILKIFQDYPETLIHFSMDRIVKTFQRFFENFCISSLEIDVPYQFQSYLIRFFSSSKDL